MKKLFYLFLLIAITLTGCYNPAKEYSLYFNVDNQTQKAIAMVSTAFPYGEAKLQVQPNAKGSLVVTKITAGFDLGPFEICNLTDNSILVVSIDELKKIYHHNEIVSERDQIISRHLKFEAGGYSWTVTDELLTLMKKDPTLVERYPEFY